jgi:hypothetical protein
MLLLLRERMCRMEEYPLPKLSVVSSHLLFLSRLFIVLLCTSLYYCRSLSR